MTSHAARIAKEREDLVAKAQIFASQANYILQQVFDDDRPLIHSVAQGKRLMVSTIDQEGLALRVDGSDVLRLKVHYYCELSESKDFLAVEASSFRLFHKDVTEPLLHFDYNRKPSSSIPAAHINIHTDSEGFRRALADSGDGRRAKRRRRRRGDSKASELHLPVGGHRFRPCLEDVLEMVIEEFDVDAGKEWRTYIRDGRVMWREYQLKAAVTDHPQAAIESLVGMGFEVRWTGESEQPSWRIPRLEAY